MGKYVEGSGRGLIRSTTLKLGCMDTGNTRKTSVTYKVVRAKARNVTRSTSQKC